MDILDKQKHIFGRLFLLSNKLQIIGDQALANEMTIRQWLMTVAVAQYKDNPPTLSEVAMIMGSSHQNVKQLAMKLKENGFLAIEKDKEDQRVIRLMLTKKSCSFWKRWQLDVKNLLTGIFKDMNKEEIEVLYNCLNKLYEGILEMQKE
ncbi:MAG: MarR family winged helix-turn-helix transcriptional regulator [Bacillota bacterium]